jgi:hypothetical protein
MFFDCAQQGLVHRWDRDSQLVGATGAVMSTPMAQVVGMASLLVVALLHHDSAAADATGRKTREQVLHGILRWWMLLAQPMRNGFPVAPSWREHPHEHRWATTEQALVNDRVWNHRRSSITASTELR